MRTLTVPPHKCCSDPFWLYRIYQDTIVDIELLMASVETLELNRSDDFKTSSLKKKKSETKHLPDGFLPSRAIGLRATMTSLKGEGLLTWKPPWNMPKSVGIVYELSLINSFGQSTLFRTRSCWLRLPASTFKFRIKSKIDVWMRSTVGDSKGPWEKKNIL